MDLIIKFKEPQDQYYRFLVNQRLQPSLKSSFWCQNTGIVRPSTSSTPSQNG